VEQVMNLLLAVQKVKCSMMQHKLQRKPNFLKNQKLFIQKNNNRSNWCKFDEFSSSNIQGWDI